MQSSCDVKLVCFLATTILSWFRINKYSEINSLLRITQYKSIPTRTPMVHSSYQGIFFQAL